MHKTYRKYRLSPTFMRHLQQHGLAPRTVLSTVTNTAAEKVLPRPMAPSAEKHREQREVIHG